MTFVDQHMQQRITDLVATCANYWELRGIAPERRREMRLELEQHLAQAVADGTSLEGVVGAHPLAFAEAWARELPHRASGGVGIVLRWVAYRWLAYVLAFLGLVALVDHVLLRAPTFPFTVTHVVIVVLFAVLGLLEAGGGFLALRIRTRERRQELIVALYALISLLLLNLKLALVASLSIPVMAAILAVWQHYAQRSFRHTRAAISLNRRGPPMRTVMIMPFQGFASTFIAARKDPQSSWSSLILSPIHI